MNARRARLLQAIAMQAGAAAPQADSHSISELQVYPVREPVSRRRYTIVRVLTRSGVSGYAECGAVDRSEVARARAAVVGRPATTFATVRTGTSLDGAVRTAMVDLAARLAKTPAFRFLGGPTRTKVRALAMLSGANDDALRRSLDSAQGQGFRAFQVPVPENGIRSVVKRLETLRSAAGQGTDFVLAGDQKLSPGDASRIGAAVESLHLLWFDEPCPTDNLQAIRKITEECVTPVGFGRDIQDLSVYQDLLREGVVDVLRPDLACHGIGGLRQVATLAETYYTAVAPSHEGGPIGTAAAIQLAACLPNFFIQNVPLSAAQEDRRMRAEIAGADIETVRDGFLSLPSAAGFGIEVNEAALAKYAEASA